MQERTFVEAISPWMTENDGSIRAHLVLAIRQAISSGQLAPGVRMPPERALAKALHVSRPTVSAVIHDLRGQGLIQSRQGSGTWVSDAVARNEPVVPFVEMIQATGRINLAAATAPDAKCLPPMRVETADLLMSEPANGLNPKGLRSLRETVAKRASVFVPGTVADNVIITSGAHQALALVVATLAPRGSTVLVEETTYGGLIDILLACGCHPVGVPRDGDGAIPEVLSDLIERHRPSLAILVSSVHSPSGTVSSPRRCADLAEVLDGTPTQVVLDETYADLEFAPSGRPLSRALGAQAIRIGSISKTIWTGLRTGWIIAPAETCKTVVRCRWQQFDLGPSAASQLFGLQALDGIDDRIVKRCAKLKDVADSFTDALGSAFPEWKVTQVDGGLAMWIELPTDGSDFAKYAASRGVDVLPGSACRADYAATPHIRLCFDRPLDVLDSAIDRLT